VLQEELEKIRASTRKFEA